MHRTNIEVPYLKKSQVNEKSNIILEGHLGIPGLTLLLLRLLSSNAQKKQKKLKII